MAKVAARKAKLGKRRAYDRIIERIFQVKYRVGAKYVDFARTDIEGISRPLRIALPKNLGDVIYTYRYRAELPPSIRETAPKGEAWLIRGKGREKYQFVLVPDRRIVPNPNMAVTKVPDATPGVVAVRLG